jgi:PAS domain S-box-containing protein
MSVSSTQFQQSHHLQSLGKFMLPSRRIAIWVIALFVISIVGVCIFLTQLHYADFRDTVHRNLHNLLVVQEQFNQKLLTELDDLTLALVADLQESEWDVDIIRNRYNAFAKDDPILRTLLILDANGTVIFDLRPEQPAMNLDVADRLYYSVHLTQRLDELYIDQPVQSRVDNNWSMPMSRAVVDDNGNLLNVIVVSISPLFWSESLNELNALGEYVGIVTHDDGIVLTTFPYIESLIGTQLSDSHLSILVGSSEDKNMLPSFVDDKLALMAMRRIEEIPVTLIIETANTEALFQFDSIVMTTTLIAVTSVISGVAVLFLYLRQHDALHLQTDNLHLANINLQQEIQSRNTIEATLSKSEERYRTVTDLISDYAFSSIITPERTFENSWLTESYYMMTGYTPEETGIVKASLSHVHPDDIDQVNRAFELTLEGKETLSEYRYLIKSGDYIWLRVKRRPIWHDGKIIHVVGAGSNITAEKEAEIALADSEKRYQIINEMISDYAFSTSVNEDGTLLHDWITQSFYTMTGYVPEEFDIVFSLKNRIHPDDIDLLKQDIELTLSDQETITEYRYQIKSGEYIWLRVKRRPIWDDDKKRVIRFIGAVSNISIEKEVEQALRESEERYRTIAELMSDFAYSASLNADGILQKDWVTDSIYAMIGYTEEEIGSLLVPVTRAHPDDIELVKRDIELTLSGQETITEYRTRIKSGQYIWIQTKRRPIWSEDKTTVVRFIGFVTNINAEKEAELALRKSEEQYRRISNVLSDFAYEYYLYPDGNINTEWLVGGSENKSLHPNKITHISQVEANAHPGDRLNVRANLKRTMENHRAITEYRISQEDGYRWVRSIREPIWDENEQRVVRILGIVKDITAEKESELALQENQQRYREVSELMSDYAYSVDTSDKDYLRIEWVVGSLEQLTGITPQEAIDDPSCLAQLTHPDDRSLVANDIKQTLHGNKTITEVRSVNAKTQVNHWLRITRQPIFDEQQTHVIRALIGVTDITAQKLAELALSDSEERYRLLTELMTDYSFSMRVEDNDRLYLEWVIGNFENIVGYPIPSAGSVNEPSIEAIYLNNIEQRQPDINQTLLGEASVIDYQIINRQDNKPRWIRMTRQPIWSADHTKVIRYLGAVKDITPEKEAELISREADQLRQDLEREKSLHELRSRFVSMVTHEFRNPLAAIQSSVSILHKYYDRISDRSRQEKFDRIYGQIDRLTNLLEDLLQVSELENHVLHFSPQRVDILDIINDLYSEYTDSIGDEHNLRLDSNLQKAMIYGDSQLLRQALGNIISNAIKYSPVNSDVTCYVTLEEQQIVIKVIDKGIGIPKNDYDRLFKAFYRASNVSTQPGTGLGLLIAQQAIELHHGAVSFTSDVGKGTQFTIAIPQMIGKEEDT